MTTVDDKMYYFYLSDSAIVCLNVTLKRSLQRSENNIKTYKKNSDLTQAANFNNIRISSLTV